MSLINDALKRASDAQAQAAQRPRAPKGVDDLPKPMVPTASRERPTWLPVVGLALVVVLLLGASGIFFVQWWKERKAWTPYANEEVDENGQPTTNLVAQAETPRVTPPESTNSTPAPVTPSTNPPTVVQVVPPPPTPPPEPPNPNPPVVAVVPPNNPAQPIPLEPPVPKTNTPPATVDVSPPVVIAVATNPPPVIPPTPTSTHPDAAKSGEPVAHVPAPGFPELMLQGISLGKKKTFATVNGKTLILGDRIEGALLVKISADSVTFEKSGAKRELFLLR